MFLNAFCFLFFLQTSENFSMKNEPCKFVVERVQELVVSSEFVSLLNDFKTLESDKIHFSNYDLELLSSRCNGMQMCSFEKYIAIKKYEKKMNALQCINNLILSYILKTINKSMLVNGQPIKNKISIIKLYKNHVARMLSVLYYGRHIAASWIITLYIKLIVASDPDLYKSVMNKYFFSQRYLLNDMKKYRKRCELDHLVPSKKQNKTAVDKFRNLDFITISKRLYNNMKLSNAYKYANLFTPEMLTLSYLFDRFDFNTVFDAVKFDWKSIKNNKWSYETHDFKELLITNQWPEVTFRFMHYHLKFQRVVYTRLLYHIWFHLRSHQLKAVRWLNFRSRLHNKHCEDINKHWTLLVEPLREAIDIFDIDDNVLISLLETFKDPDGENVNPIILNLYEMKTRHILATNFFELYKSQKITRQIFKKRKHRCIKPKKIKENIFLMYIYITQIKNLLTSMDKSMFFIKFVSQEILQKYDLYFFPYYITN